MASEIQYRHTATAATLYCTLSNAAGQYWDTTGTPAFETLVPASWGNYDTAMAETPAAGYHYVGTFPTGITTAGTYSVTIYAQAGASPAITDTVLARQSIAWSGSEVLNFEDWLAGTSTGSSGTDLTTAAKVKRYMGITAATWDTLIGELITAASRRIERICGRTFAAADYAEWYSGNGQRVLCLRQHPVIYVAQVANGAANAISVSASGFIKATIQVYESGVRLYSMDSAGTATSTNLAFADYPTHTLMTAAIDAVTGWTAAVVEDGPSAMLRPATIDVTATTGYLTWLDTETTFTVDHATGMVAYGGASSWPEDDEPHRMAAGFRNWYVNYRAGYATIPADVEMLANEIVSDMYNGATHDGTIKSESLGDYSYSLSDHQELAAGQMERLRRYMNVAVGGLR